MTELVEAAHRPQRTPCIVSLVSSFNRRYPGEDVTLFCRLAIRETVQGFRLQVTLPEGLVPGVTRAPRDMVPQVAFDEGMSHLLWTIEEEIETGTDFEYQVQAQVAATHEDKFLQSRAVVIPQGPDEESLPSHAETVSILVSAKGAYLKHLPSLYHKDELMGRFLMLFESFLAPIEGQIQHLPLYFDPKLTPPDFLPWLASWFDLALDERWPEERRRLLLQSAAWLYRKRGTKQGLQRYLEIFTGETVEIIEHRANNFRLGPEGTLGPAIAIGTSNVPHTFTVILPSSPTEADDDENARKGVERLRIIEAIIQAEKPAHTGYNLRFETD